jgi:hypothetical protein
VLSTVAAAGITAVLLGVGLGGCANGAALGLARQACHHVELSLTLYHSSLAQHDARLAADERGRASDQLQTAAPLAAVAAGQSPQWQALMATLSESSRLPESDLVYALQAQCAQVQGAATAGPTLPPTTLPAAPKPSPG